MFKYSTGSFVNSRNQNLYTASWVPADGVIKVHLVWVHGYGEYIDRWSKVFERYASEGIAVYGHDSHGMGKSEPFTRKERGLVWKFSHLVEDTLAFSDLTFKHIEESGSQAPVFIGGISMGGLVATHVALQRGGDSSKLPNGASSSDAPSSGVSPPTSLSEPVAVGGSSSSSSSSSPSSSPSSSLSSSLSCASRRVFAGLLLQSPALDVEWTTVLRLQAKVGDFIASLTPRVRIVPAVRPEDMCQDPKVVREYLADKMIIHGNLCANTGNELLKGFRQLAPLRRRFCMPVFGVMGTSDRCTSLSALRTFIAEASSTDKELLEIPGGYHELCQGPEREQVIAAMANWIFARSGSKTGSGFEKGAPSPRVIPGVATEKPAAAAGEDQSAVDQSAAEDQPTQTAASAAAAKKKEEEEVDERPEESADVDCPAAVDAIAA